MSKKLKLTRWFKGYQKPMRKGVYERDYSDVKLGTAYCKWDGVCWHLYARTAAEAVKEDFPSFHQHLPWRGLAAKP